MDDSLVSEDGGGDADISRRRRDNEHVRCAFVLVSGRAGVEMKAMVNGWISKCGISGRERASCW